MITIKRKLWGIAPYTTSFFPSESGIDNALAELGPFETARFFYTQAWRELDHHVVAREPGSTVWVDLARSTDALLDGCHRNCRQQIRHVEKKLLDRVTIRRNGPQTIDDFLAVFNGFARVKDHVAPVNERILQRFAAYADFFVIYLDGNPMCAHSVLRDEESLHARLLFLGSRRLEGAESAARCSDLNRFLHWHEIQTYRSEGFGTFDFGGIRNDPRDGIFRFKTSFGGSVVSEQSYLCAGSSWVGRLAGRLRRRANITADPHAAH